jgi:hypothetical protein
LVAEAEPRPPRALLQTFRLEVLVEVVDVASEDSGPSGI